MRRALFTIAVLLACLIYVPRPAAAAMLTFPSATITDSNPFDVDIQIQDVDFLYSFFFNVLYDPAVVELVNVQEGSFLTDATIPPATPPNTTAFGFDGSVPGTIGIFNTLISAPVGATGSGSLALVTFRPLMNGNPGIGFSDLSFAAIPSAVPCDAQDLLCPGDVFPLEVNATPGEIVIRQTTPVPEPATFTILGLGLLGLARRLR